MATNVMDLVAKLTIDDKEYDAKLTGAETKANGFINLVGGGMATAAMGVATTAVAGTVAVTKAVVDFTKQATDAYGEYEQLEGGIQTLFGEAAPQVMEDASNAFNDAGMSINQYMETSIQSAAALINSLEGDQAKAAELMNVSIVDMSDNVNKMGTTMEAVQNAYRGFSRGNFTMLDNLALGFSGTKQGMQELLDKAKEISGVEYDIESYSDIVQAIHVVQKEMGISGTTMDEAGKTITGSLGAVRAAWQNLIIGLGNENADLGQLMDNVLNSIFGKDGEGGFLSNILPRIQAVLSRLPMFIVTALQKLPEILSSFIPNIISAILETYSEMLAYISENSDEIVEGILSLFDMILENVMSFMEMYVEMLPVIMDVAMQIITKLGEGLAESLPELLPAIVNIFMAIYKVSIDNLPTILDVALQIIIALIEGMLNALPDVIMGIVEIILSLTAAIYNMLPVIIEAGLNLIMVLINAIVENGMKILSGDYFLQLLNMLRDVWDKINFFEIGANIIKGLIDGIKNGWGDLKSTVSETADGIKNNFKDFFGIQSPSKVFEYYGKMMMDGLDEGLNENMGEVDNDISSLNNNINKGFNNIAVAGAGNIIIPVTIGDETVQTIVVDAMNIANYRSGGR